MDNAPSAWTVQVALSSWHATRSRLLTEDVDLAQDEQQLAALLGAETDDITEIEHRLARAIVTATAMAETADTLAANLIARRDRYRRRVQQYKATLFAIMDAIGCRRLELPDCTVSTRAGPPAVIVTDEAALPDRFIRVETTRRADKAAIATALKDGEVVDGAELSNAMPVLSVRSR
jgi:hypothetical protein